jgi:hypothetical protein
MWSRSTVGFAAMICVVAIAAGSAFAWREKPVAGPDPAVAEWPEWPHRAICGEHLTFDPVSVFSGPPRAERGNIPPEVALRREINRGPEWIPHQNWRLAAQKHGYAEFFHGRLGAELESGEELSSITFQRKRGHWRTVSYSQLCYLWTMRHGQEATTWLLTEKQPPLTPETRRIHVYVGAHCSRHEKPPTLAGTPEFLEFPGKLVMTLWLRPQPFNGHEVCEPGLGPGPSMTIELPEPLGERELFDGGSFPPQPAPRYERPTVIGL